MLRAAVAHRPGRGDHLVQGLRPRARALRRRGAEPPAPRGGPRLDWDGSWRFDRYWEVLLAPPDVLPLRLPVRPRARARLGHVGAAVAEPSTGCRGGNWSGKLCRGRLLSQLGYRVDVRGVGLSRTGAPGTNRNGPAKPCAASRLPTSAEARRRPRSWTDRLAAWTDPWGTRPKK